MVPILTQSTELRGLRAMSAARTLRSGSAAKCGNTGHLCVQGGLLFFEKKTGLSQDSEQD